MNILVAVRAVRRSFGAPIAFTGHATETRPFRREPLLRHCAPAVCVQLRPEAIQRVLICSDTSARVVLAAPPLRGQEMVDDARRQMTILRCVRAAVIAVIACSIRMIS
jgi:hypothetical protein